MLQGVHVNYDIDLMRDPHPRHRRADRRRRRRAAAGRATASSPTTCAPASFLVADGVDPSNEGRGYVLRRIMRRAMRHAQLLGARDPLMWRLVPALVARDGSGLSRTRCAPRRCIAETLKLEETRFRITLARGLSILEDETRALPPGGELAGRGRVQALRHLSASRSI